MLLLLLNLLWEFTLSEEKSQNRTNRRGGSFSQTQNIRAPEKFFYQMNISS
jgi:hypothetical protein